MPGKSNKAADATSRHPSLSTYTQVTCLELSTVHDRTEHALNAAIARDTSDLTSISWQEISDETASDPILSPLVMELKEGFPSDQKTLDVSLTPFWNIRDSLHVADHDVIMYGDRVVIPSTLRSRILRILYSAHQGTTGMEARAHALLFWPGISRDIKYAREECSLCCKNAP